MRLYRFVDMALWAFIWACLFGAVLVLAPLYALQAVWGMTEDIRARYGGARLFDDIPPAQRTVLSVTRRWG